MGFSDSFLEILVVSWVVIVFFFSFFSRAIGITEELRSKLTSLLGECQFFILFGNRLSLEFLSEFRGGERQRNIFSLLRVLAKVDL
jgi:hypothetical protein